MSSISKKDLHPGVKTALQRLTGNELDIARMMTAGELSSPQRVGNMWLYNVRVTGTGASYRPKHNEYVWRKPDDYLTDDFLQRIGGLPVIWKHPPNDELNSDEYADRNVGSVFLPYIRGDEVWAIVRIYDDDAAELLNTEQLSTSPAVLLEKGTSLKTRLEDGSDILIEGPAQSVDHLAIVPKGVWDKGGPSTGIENAYLPEQVSQSVLTRGDESVAEETEAERKAREEKEKAARSDAERRMDESVDTLLKGIDSIRSDMAAIRGDVAACNKRMDAFETQVPEDEEARRREAEQKAAAAEAAERSQAEKSAEGDLGNEEEPTGGETGELGELKDQLATALQKIEELTNMVRQPVADADRPTMEEIQSRCDSVMISHAKRAPVFMAGEKPGTYRRRLAGLLQGYSKIWKGKRLDLLPDEVFDEVEKQIYTDAMDAALHPSDFAEGEMRKITRTNDFGHKITEFVGPSHFVKQFGMPPRRARIRDRHTS